MGRSRLRCGGGKFDDGGDVEDVWDGGVEGEFGWGVALFTVDELIEWDEGCAAARAWVVDEGAGVDAAECDVSGMGVEQL